MKAGRTLCIRRRARRYLLIIINQTHTNLGLGEAHLCAYACEMRPIVVSQKKAKDINVFI